MTLDRGILGRTPVAHMADSILCGISSLHVHLVQRSFVCASYRTLRRLFPLCLDRVLLLFVLAVLAVEVGKSQDIVVTLHVEAPVVYTLPFD